MDPEGSVAKTLPLSTFFLRGGDKGKAAHEVPCMIPSVDRRYQMISDDINQALDDLSIPLISS